MKYTIIKFLVLIIVVAIAFGIYARLTRIDRDLLNGEIVSELKLNNPQVSGICAIRPSNKEIKKYVDGEYPSLNEKGDKFLFTKNRKIYEYDISRETEKIIFDGNGRIITEPRYIPCKNQISFIYRGDVGITLYDIDNNSTQANNNIEFTNYIWLNDGESILIDSSYVDPIYKYNLKTKTKEVFIENGISPVFSKNFDFIAFRKRGGWLTIKSLITGQEWTSNFKNINSYCLSPSGDYIVYERESSKYMFVEAKELLIWDYKKNKTERLIKQKYLYSIGDLDWK